MKKIETLVNDIYAVVEGKGGWDETITQFLAEGISSVAYDRFHKPQQVRDYLSLSALGTSCYRKLWYRVNLPEAEEPLKAEALGTFFYGDLAEVLVIALAKASGHDVQGCQDVVEVHGIKGHRDCIIDGMTVDVKSASGFGFKKFEKGSLREDDPFGYISQLSSYVYAGKDDPIVKDKTKGAFLAINKERFKLVLDVYDFTEELTTKAKEISDIKEAVALDDVNDINRMPTVAQSKTSPNKKLDTICSYCGFKKECWPKARKFIYSTGPVWLTEVNKIPDVTEVIE